ncbi:coenzyme F420-0:L-glutamate ligase [Jidongwangia harbinensis]|uniref:coenzyme F420-0:L-glutamate ligase n=1 Tax=Jidongwangia harbinensis TaxID=2878561 RepID=UPI001CDA1D59|nr:coenzyme F420-0:L-glutamate ligase [Jidongwangia harbinensis]MCA2215590.1 coenzyme F420-0:L-glutamate ligase [Jidongwangia harbinensis]
MMDGLEILPVRGIGDVTAGDDLAETILHAAPWLRDGDVLVVTSKIVSKAEGRLVEVPADGPEREVAREQILADETARVVARRGPTAIVQTHHGFVMASAGIDASNVDKTHLVLLPRDPDASAQALRDGFLARGLHVGVIVSDTTGRAWRNGLTDVALGSAGIEPVRDHRGEIDPYGNELQLTQMAVVDELAGAGELVKGKRDRVPVAVVRGYPGAGLADTPGARLLLRDAASDMFSLGTAEARAAGLREAATLPEAAPVPAASGPGASPPAATDPARIERALATVADHLASDTTPTTAAPADPAAGTGPVVIRLTTSGTGPAAWVRLGADAHRLRAALAAEGTAARVTVDDEGVLIVPVP